MTQEQAWSIACSVYDAAEQAADEAYAVSIFRASALSGVSVHALATADAQFTLAMRVARKALDVARFN